jgi:hypothetical protein
MILRLRGIDLDCAAAGAFDEDFAEDGLAEDFGGGEGVSSSTMGRFCHGQYAGLQSIERERQGQMGDEGIGGRRTRSDGRQAFGSREQGGGMGSGGGGDAMPMTGLSMRWKPEMRDL